MTNQEKFIRGEIAVAIVSEMFREARYRVYHFGYEYTLPGLAQRGPLQMEKNSPPRRKISAMPDLVVMNEQGEVDFVEVKYHKSEEDGPAFKEWLQKAVHYWPEAKLLLLHPYEPYFQISTIADYERTRKLYRLESDQFLRVDRRLVTKYAAMLKDFLG